MATLLYRLGKTAFRRWPVFIAAWLLVMIGVGVVAATWSKPMTDSFSIPGIPSEEAAGLQAELFPGTTDAFDQATVNVVVAAPEGHTPTSSPTRSARAGRAPCSWWSTHVTSTPPTDRPRSASWSAGWRASTASATPR